MFTKTLKVICIWFRRLLYKAERKNNISNLSISSQEESSEILSHEHHGQTVTQTQNPEDENMYVKVIEPLPDVHKSEKSLGHHHEVNAYDEALETPKDQKNVTYNTPISKLPDGGRYDQIDVGPDESIHEQIRNESEPLVSDIDELEEISSLLPDDNSDLCEVLPIDVDTLASISGGTRSDSEQSYSEVTKPKEKDTAKLQAPRNIGSRRSRSIASRRESGPRRPNISRPELICRSGPISMAWEIIVTADEDCKLSAVQLNEEFLKYSAQQCHIPSFTGRLIISCQDEQRHDVPLFDENPLIFKLRKNWSGEGRKIARITSGYFIVIAPASWERTGRAPVEPDACADPTFRAHYFYRDAKASGVNKDGFREWNSSVADTGIDLVGRRVFDDSDEGDLFVGDPPILEPSPEIKWARVGEEAKHGWRGKNFAPTKPRQSLSNVLNGRDGHYFLRIYDSQVRLLDSTEFRYLQDLEHIHVNGSLYTQDTILLPGVSGYPPTEVRFIGANGLIRTPVLLPETHQFMAQSGTIMVPPYPDADRILCSLGTGTSAVNIILDLPRIWWRLEGGESSTDKWHDIPLVMTREEFKNYADAGMRLSLLSKRQVSVHAGFDNEPGQRYDRKIEDDCIEIPLAHFVDHAQIDRRLSTDTHFNIQWAGEILPLIRICADLLPEIVSFSAKPAKIFAGQKAILRWVTRNVSDADVVIDPDIGVVDSDGTRSVLCAKTTQYTLTLAVSGAEDVTRVVTVSVYSSPALGYQPAARVKCAGRGWRNGKGFSYREIKDAGLTMREAVGRFLPIDRRRRSSHPINVKTIKRTLDA